MRSVLTSANLWDFIFISFVFIIFRDYYYCRTFIKCLIVKVFFKETTEDKLKLGIFMSESEEELPSWQLSNPVFY